MKISYEIEPQETEVICKCITDIFGVYAEVETKSSLSTELLKTLVEKISNLPQQPEEVKCCEEPVKVTPPKKAERDFREEK